ncbi:hypothetical protein IEQ34_021416 [Dendrobium chrysotoxum]|uniref:Uncharacterized protein n=1 Tax=Dendrobium chrysotoxum TaxID=161865 RepID=A0AAV7G525_DENCH|nr:hypothetical protein IEQ34_021416 [Dendrobium chrysotoxum]
MKIVWGLIKKWGKMKDLLVPLHVEEEDIMKILNVPDIEHLLYEISYLKKYIGEEFLFKAKGDDPQAVLKKKKLEGILVSTSRVPPNASPVKLHIPKDAHDHIYDVKVKALEQQCIDEGFIRGFLKGVRLVQRKIRVNASNDSPSNLDGVNIESELKKAFSTNDEIIEIE